MSNGACKDALTGHGTKRDMERQAEEEDEDREE